MALYRKRQALSCSSKYCGEFPEYGAIFMSSSATKEECLERNLFGLPLASASFVKAVRPGMILFLFEYKCRRLYGVYEAVSHGQLNIVPHAFRSSSPKPFPAQVCVRVIWDCLPLPEDVFRDAISDNYYEKFKFNFGLSRQQVHGLLRLFDSQRMRVEKPLLKNKARKRHSRTSSERRNLVMTKGIATTSYRTTGQKESDQHVGVSPTGSLVLGDYIPLSSPHRCDIEVNVSVIPRLNMHPPTQEREDYSGTSGGFSRKITDFDLVPRFVRQKEKKTREADHHKMEDLVQRHESWKLILSKRGQIESSERASVFSRLTFT